MHELENEWFPEPISDFWTRKVGSVSDTLFFEGRDNWIEDLKSNLCQIYGFSSVKRIPSEYTALHIYSDNQSSICLWIRMNSIDPNIADLGSLRKLVDLLFDIHGTSATHVSDGHSARVHSLLHVMGADMETGLVSKSVFVSRFSVWFSIWSWWTCDRESVFGETLNAWTHVDVSDCGVLSRSSLNGTLLPYIFRLWFPRSLGYDDSDLQDKWIVAMMSFLNGKKSQWINHWVKFADVDPLNFSGSDMLSLTRPALRFLNLNQDQDYFVAECSEFLSNVHADPKVRSRAFALWLFSLDHSSCRSDSIPDSVIEAKATIDSPTEFKVVCTAIWNAYFPDSKELFFDQWYRKMVPLKFPVIRSEFVTYFLTNQEIQVLSETVISAEKKVLVKKFENLLIAIHSKHSLEGKWIIQEWISDILTLAPSRPFIDEASFKSAFPIWFATLLATKSACSPSEDPRLGDVWPPELGEKNIYSKETLTQLLEAVWKKYAPANMPCQAWWVERCCERLKGAASVNRTDFCSLFPTTKEINIILFMCKSFGSATIAHLLLHTASFSDSTELMPNNYVQEFFLIANLKPIDSDNPINIPRDIFTYAFPLWCAAHYVK